LFNAHAFWINYNRIFIESVARNDVKAIKSKKLYDGIGEKNDYCVGFEDNRITYIGSEKPLQNDVEMIVEDAVLTPAFIDLHSHIGMVRGGEPGDGMNLMTTCIPSPN
jgi:imidazolonepropionase-like amidohydrolase